MNNKYHVLIGYAMKILPEKLGGNKYLDEYPPPTDEWIIKYENAIGVKQRTPDVLPSIFSFVSFDKDNPPPLTYVAPLPFELEAPTFTAHTEDEAKAVESDGAKFQRELAQLVATLKGLGNDHLFEGFYHLFRRWASGLPGSCGDEGISLFEQWKAITAIAFATGDNWEAGPAQDFTLVGGDIPGIQDFVYTITSRGATRGLRGRSFFIQLLGDAVIHRLLAEFNLASPNLIYAAGGNFMLLAPAGINDRLQEISEEIEKSLLKSFEGDLAMCLAWEPVELRQISTNEFSDPVSRSLKEKIAKQKQRRFSHVATSEWASLFAPQGKPGNKHCVICQRMLGDKEGILMDQLEADQEPAYRCAACDGFQNLASDLAAAKLFILTTRIANSVQHWQKALHALCGKYYLLSSSHVPPSADSWVYLINKPNFSDKAHGYKLIANTTPRVSDADLTNYKDDLEAHSTRGSVRPFSLLAALSKGLKSDRGIKRLGILRMDVDNLGQIIIRGLKSRSLTSTSALSAALDQFFTGWMNKICEDVNSTRDCLYTIYAGGDDLFIVGSWDLMPDLAYKIKTQFTAYTGRNPTLNISGGISIEGKKFPLYQAAERAGEFEGKAKAYSFNGIEKNALCFLDEVFNWSEWEQNNQSDPSVLYYKKLLEGTFANLPGEMPNSLLDILQDIYNQYLELQRKTGMGKFIFGPWTWRAAYALTRLEERINHKKYPDARATTTPLKKAATSYPSLRYAAVAARWIELLNRKENN